MGAAEELKQDHVPEHGDDHDDDPPQHKKAEEGEGPWLVSYADLMTLLMGFFALVSSFSTPSKEEMEKIKESATRAFGGQYEKPYQDIGTALMKVIKDNKLEEQVQVHVDIQGVQLTFRGTIFFDSGDFKVKADAIELMNTVAQVVKDQPRQYKALIEGHTDSLPISHPIIASNWELSGLRAARIAQIFEKNGFQRDQLTIIGWGDAHPMVPNADANGAYIPENMVKNRRVVLRVYDDKISDNPFQGTKSGAAPAGSSEQPAAASATEQPATAK